MQFRRTHLYWMAWVAFTVVALVLLKATSNDKPEPPKPPLPEHTTKVDSSLPQIIVLQRKATDLNRRTIQFIEVEKPVVQAENP